MGRRAIVIEMLAVAAIFAILGCATLPKDFDRPESHTLTETQDTAFGRAFADKRAAFPGKSGFHLLGNGLDAFVARAVLADFAERSIDVQYYIYHDDLIGKLFTDLLLKAADRGVRVRMLVDDMDLVGRDLGAVALNRHPGIEVRIFNPFSRQAGRLSQLITRFGSVTRRMHNKSFFVPGEPGAAFLCHLARQGIRVCILTNSLASNDVGMVHAGYKKYRKDLLRAGVELYELNKMLTRQQQKWKKMGVGGSSKASLHSKSFVFDRKQIFIGSLNLDPRSLVHNTEIGVIVKVPEIADGMARWFDENVDQIAFRLELKNDGKGSEQLLWHGRENGESVTYTSEPHAGFWRRLGVAFMGLWPIESQL